MSCVEKLSIQGVRSFSPHKAEVIAFQKPLTIIVGQNGCGKTTIIESLLYATTGTMPPTSDKGKTFVHDPKVSGTDQTKSKVMVRLTNRGGQEFVVVRTAEVTQKRSKASFKATDGVIKMRDPESGKPLSNTHRCTDLDKMVPQLMGISKAILHNVIFCHQEESNWPLGDGKQLKSKFDEIFESTRYSKALEAIRKAKRDKQSKSLVFKGEKNVLAEKLRVAKGLRLELEQKSQQREQIDEQTRENEARITRGERELQELSAKCDKYNDKALYISKLDAKLEQQKKSLSEAIENMESEFKGTDAELQIALNEFDQQAARGLGEVQALEDAQQKRAAEKEQLSRHRNDLASQRGKLELERDQQEEAKRRYERFADEVRQKKDISARIDGGERLQGVELGSRLQAVLDAEVQSLRTNLQSTKSGNKKEEDRLSQRISAKNGELHAKTQQRDAKRKEHGQEQRKLQHKEERLNQIRRMGRCSERDVEECTEQLQKRKEEEKEIMGDGRTARAAEEMSKNQKALKDMEHEFEDAKMIVRTLQMLENEEKEIEGKKAGLSSREKELRGRIERCMPQFQAVVGREMAGLARVSDDRGAVADAVDSRKTALDHDMARKKQAGETRQKFAAKLEHTKSVLEKKQEQSDRLAQRMDEAKQLVHKYVPAQDIAAAGTDYDAPLKLFERMAAKVQDNVKKYTGKKEEIGYAHKFLLTYHKKGHETHECPLCLRGLHGEDLDRFQRNVQDKLDATSQHTGNAQQRKEKADQANREMKTVDGLKPYVAEYNKLQLEVTDLKREIAEIEADGSAFQRAQADAEQLEEHCFELQEKYDLAKKLLVEMESLQTASSELGTLTARITRDVSRLKQKITQATGGSKYTSLAEAIETREKLIGEISQLQKKISTSHKAQQEQLQKQTVARSRVDEAEQQLKEAEQKVDEYRRLEREYSDLRELCETLQTAADDLELQLAPLQNELEDFERERNRQRKRWQTAEEKLEKEIKSMESDADKHKQLMRVVSRGATDNKAAALQQLEADVKHAEKQIEEVSKQMNAAEEKIRKRKAIQDQQAAHKRMLHDNVLVRKKQSAVKADEAELKQLRDQIGLDEGSMRETSEKMEQMRRDVQKLRDKNNSIGGERGQIVAAENELKTKLKSREYDKIDEHHRQALIKYETTKMAVDDLDQYHIALDKALMRYHEMKISEINSIIKELWSLTYRGEDIETVAISTSASGKATTNRSYNYRVVMRKGDAELDMRGRCSAGQKVLAGLVIRLALAETFCVDCGILALDEPTTNLDTVNKNGLADAIGKIITGRTGQKNFQLICITHDEDFVNCLGQAQLNDGMNPGHYFRISRQQDGTSGPYYSKIERQDWGDWE